MRDFQLFTAWPRRPWLLSIVAACGCFLPLLLALGQTSRPEPPEPRARFGSVTALEAKRVLPVSATSQQPPDKDSQKKKPGVDDKDGGVLLYAMPVTPPSVDQLFLLDSEEMFRDRLRAEVRQRSPKFRLEFPDANPPAQPPQAARFESDYVKWVEPHFVISKRLFFEQPRFERFGESLGVLQPVVSTGVFGFDILAWPVRRLAHPFQCYQLNTDSYSPYFQAVGK